MTRQPQSKESSGQRTPNRKGREGNPISLAPLTFDEALRKMLATEPPKPEPKPQKQPAKHK